MKTYLVKQCSRCSTTLRIIIEDGKIIDAENCEPYPLALWTKGLLKHKDSNKTVLCKNRNDSKFICKTESKVRYFTEIKA